MLSITVDTTDLKALQRHFTTLSSKNIRYSVANAMTASAKSAQAALRAQMDSKIKGGAVPFTRNSTYVRFARPTDLTAEVGFKQYATKGTAAGRYLQYASRGGQRVAKSSERQLRSAGLIGPNQFIVPTDVRPLKLNKYGNLTGGTYTQVLSRLKALGEQGYSANTSNSKRSQGKRRQRDYFIGRPGGLPLGIYARLGKRPKNGGLPQGFHTVFYVTGQPNYQPTFPIKKILESTFNNNYERHLRDSLREAVQFKQSRIAR